MDFFLTVVCVVVLALPYISVGLAPSVSLGFVRVTAVLFGVHIFVALLLQSIEMFSFVSVALFHGVGELVFLGMLYKRGLLSRSLRRLRLVTIDWSLVLVVILSFFALYQVHFNYSGTYNEAGSFEYKQAQNLSHPYPYFSDEWYAVAFAQRPIETGGLPLGNPFDRQDDSFFNVQFPFHAGVAEIATLLRVDITSSYVVFGIVCSVGIVLLLYMCIKELGVNTVSAALVSLGSLFVVNGGNMPGLWNFMPVHAGVIVFLMGIFFLCTYDTRGVVGVIFLITLLYPPLLLIFLSMFGVSLLEKEYSKKTILYSALACFLGVGALVLLGAVGDIEYLLSKVWYESFLGDVTPYFFPHYIMPAWLLSLSCVGMFVAVRESKVLVVGAVISLLFWGVYLITPMRFMIGLERIIFVSTMILVILAGFGIHFVLVFLQERVGRWIRYVPHIGIIVLAVCTCWYTQGDGWQKLVVVDYVHAQVLLPAAPAQIFFQREDVAVVNTHEKGRFLSHPWHGVALGVLTQHTPVVTKPGTVSINSHLYDVFMSARCEEKRKIAQEYNVQFVYTPAFSCEGFVEVQKSTGHNVFVLYDVEN